MPHVIIQLLYVSDNGKRSGLSIKLMWIPSLHGLTRIC